MKAEERHELKENDMVSWFQYGLPIFLKQYGSYLLLALALCLLGYQLWNYREKKHAVEVQSAWNELAAASNPNTENAPAKLQAIINEYNVKPVQALAWLQIATFYTDAVAHGNPPEGYNGVKVTKDDALASAEKAANHVINEFPDQTLAVGKAHLALATIAEDRGDWDAAKKQYELLSDKGGPFADTAFALTAEAQLKLLDPYRKAPPLAAMVPPPATQAAVPSPFPTLSGPPIQTIAPIVGPSTQPAATLPH